MLGNKGVENYLNDMELVYLLFSKSIYYDDKVNYVDYYIDYYNKYGNLKIPIKYCIDGFPLGLLDYMLFCSHFNYKLITISGEEVYPNRIRDRIIFALDDYIRDICKMPSRNELSKMKIPTYYEQRNKTKEELRLEYTEWSNYYDKYFETYKKINDNLVHNKLSYIQDILFLSNCCYLLFKCLPYVYYSKGYSENSILINLAISLNQLQNEKYKLEDEYKTELSNMGMIWNTGSRKIDAYKMGNVYRFIFYYCTLNKHNNYKQGYNNDVCNCENLQKKLYNYKFILEEPLLYPAKGLLNELNYYGKSIMQLEMHL